jgi:secreted Zn-dependent insulinase-like peptidase
LESSVLGPDGVLDHINNFLVYVRDNDFKDFNDELVEESKRSLINNIRDYKDLSLVEEANRIWKEIKDNRGAEDFNRNEKKIIALEKVTKESVQALFNKLFFE